MFSYIDVFHGNVELLVEITNGQLQAITIHVPCIITIQGLRFQTLKTQILSHVMFLLGFFVLMEFHAKCVTTACRKDMERAQSCKGILFCPFFKGTT